MGIFDFYYIGIVVCVYLLWFCYFDVILKIVLQKDVIKTWFLPDSTSIFNLFVMFVFVFFVWYKNFIQNLKTFRCFWLRVSNFWRSQCVLLITGWCASTWLGNRQYRTGIVRSIYHRQGFMLLVNIWSKKNASLVINFFFCFRL